MCIDCSCAYDDDECVKRIQFRVSCEWVSVVDWWSFNRLKIPHIRRRTGEKRITKKNSPTLFFFFFFFFSEFTLVPKGPKKKEKKKGGADEYKRHRNRNRKRGGGGGGGDGVTADIIEHASPLVAHSLTQGFANSLSPLFRSAKSRMVTNKPTNHTHTLTQKKRGKKERKKEKKRRGWKSSVLQNNNMKRTTTHSAKKDETMRVQK